MGVIINKEKKKITTSDGIVLVRRVTTVRLPNGKYRYPIDYYDATPGAVKVSEKEMENLKVPGYKQII